MISRRIRGFLGWLRGAERDADRARLAAIDGGAAFSIGLLHVDPAAAPGAADVPRAPWPAFHARIAPAGADVDAATGPVTWSFALLHPDGTRAAASRPVRGRFAVDRP